MDSASASTQIWPLPLRPETSDLIHFSYMDGLMQTVGACQGTLNNIGWGAAVNTGHFMDSRLSESKDVLAGFLHIVHADSSDCGHAQ